MSTDIKIDGFSSWQSIDVMSFQVHHDMNAPLSHYFMYTGHNSYLTRNQHTSESSDEPIIEALQQGVRVIELDLWPSSSQDGIKVVHGRYWTTKWLLQSHLRVIHRGRRKH